MSGDQHAAGGRDLAAYEADYAAHTFEAVQARLRKRMLLELLARERPDHVLEIGCGADTLANHWQDAETFTIVEPAAGFAATARRDTSGRAGVEVVEGFVEAAAPHLKGRRFDLIVLSGVIQEVPEPEALLGAVRGLADAHTLVHVNVPNARSIHRLLGFEMGVLAELTALSSTQVRLQQARTYTQQTLQSLLTHAGFEVRDSGSYFVKPFTHAQMQALRETGFLTDELLEGLWGLARHLPDFGSEIFVNVRRRP